MKLNHVLAVGLGCVAVGASAQELPSRVGLGVGLVLPQGDIQSKVGQGLALSLSVHFNREATHEGRLRIEESSMGEKTENQTVSYGYPSTATQRVNRTAHALSVGYDWMPGNEHVRAILGLGGMFWYQEAKITDPGGYSYRQDAAGFAMVPTLGVQVRFNRHVGMEARYVLAKNDVASDKTSLETQMNHLVFGLEFRF